MAFADYCLAAAGDPWHGPYHDTEYGVPLDDETRLFERLALEIFQAGLSWLTILKKRPALVAAFDGFQVDRVAAYGPEDQARLLADPGIIRNRRKIAALVTNAGRLQGMRGQDGGFAAWLARNHPLSRADWVRLFRQRFVFMGEEIVNEFLLSTGYLPGAHKPHCAVGQALVAANPPWLQAARAGFAGYDPESVVPFMAYKC